MDDAQSPRVQRALAKAARMRTRIDDLERDLTNPALDETARQDALLALEALMLTNRGSSEEDHRKQLVLVGLEAAVEVFLGPSAPRAAEYEASPRKSALLAEVALHELRLEYPEEAALLPDEEVAASVLAWSLRLGAAR